eukprot:4229522-Pleurochrysis_carterae.AAC.2
MRAYRNIEIRTSVRTHFHLAEATCSQQCRCVAYQYDIMFAQQLYDPVFNQTPRAQTCASMHVFAYGATHPRTADRCAGSSLSPRMRCNTRWDA